MSAKIEKPIDRGDLPSIEDDDEESFESAGILGRPPKPEVKYSLRVVSKESSVYK